MAAAAGAATNQKKKSPGRTRVRKARRVTLLLAEVEYDQALFREAPEQFARNRAKIAKVRREDVADAHHVQRECHEGDGLESCVSIEVNSSPAYCLKSPPKPLFRIE